MITDDEFKRLFGKNIKKYRNLKNIKQADLAKEIGILETSLSRIENGYDFVKVSTIIKLCNVLGCKPSELFDFEVD